jgi:protein-S-isoprenylcysteine O-methyltransferase Ste14
MPEHTLFRLLALVYIVIAVAISASHRRRADKVGGQVLRTPNEPPVIRHTLSFGGLALLGGVIAYLAYPASMSWSMLPLPPAVRWIGVALAALTCYTTWWVFSSLGLNVTPTVVTRPEARLVTHGPYRFVRHPLYVNAVLSVLALSLISTSWWFAAIIGPTLIALTVRTREEEANLERRFGDSWREYASRTGRFLPRPVLRRLH